ncbi:MAG: hypothetical protein P8N43_11530, partial [Alphaproteobacteria bacterium]|nr:hypothetical protein [Alphaproteobacteria bacterium]
FQNVKNQSKLEYRPMIDQETWAERDGVLIAGRQLDPARRAEIEDTINQEIDRAVAFAEASDFPSIEELGDHVFAS